MSFDFAGQFVRKFDQANRMAVPTDHRDGLGETIFILKALHGEKCLLLFSAEEWETFSRDFVDSYSGEKQAVAQRRLSSRVDKVTIDKSGRIMLKEDFKAFADLTDEVLVMGIMNRVELWNAQNWADWNAAIEEDDEFSFAPVSYTGKRRPQ